MLSQAAAQTAAAALDRVTVAVSPRLLVQRAALDAALKLGAFRAEGLSVALSKAGSTTAALDAVAKNEAQFALAGPGVIGAIVGRKVPLRVIAAVSSRLPFVFYARKRSGITALADLKGKTIQTSGPRGRLDIIWKQMLAGAGIAPGGVKRMVTRNGLAAIRDGAVDVAGLDSTLIDKARAAGLIRIADFNDWRKDRWLGAEQGSHLSWVASRKLLAARGAIARAFLSALVKATVRMREDRLFAVSVLRAKPFGLSEISAHQVYDLHQRHWVVRLDPVKNDLGFDIVMAEISMRRPRGSITLQRFAAPDPIGDVLAELEISF